MSAGEKTDQRVLVLDTSALVMGIDPSTLSLPVYTVSSVGDELAPDALPSARYHMSQMTRRLIVKDPSELSLKIVREMSVQVGDSGVLSKTDADVLALSLDLKESGLTPTIVSDDYAIQNVSEMLGIEHASLATFGIAMKFDWIYYCPACFRKYTVEDAGRVCRVCGTRLKRKVMRKRPTKRKVGRK